MRIIAGKHRRRILGAPPGSTTRPTADRARETLFNILENAGYGPDGGSAVRGARVLDGFAGSGALGLEALSRGALHATFIDNDQSAIRAVEDNITALSEQTAARCIKANMLRPPAADSAADLVFLDPPYHQELAVAALKALEQAGWAQPGTLWVIETGADEEISAPKEYQILDDRRIGAARIRLLKRG